MDGALNLKSFNETKEYTTKKYNHEPLVIFFFISIVQKLSVPVPVILYRTMGN